MIGCLRVSSFVLREWNEEVGWSSICWFMLQMLVIARAGSGTEPGIPFGWQGLKHLDCHPLIPKNSERKLDHKQRNQDLNQWSTMGYDIQRGSLTSCATDPIPEAGDFFLCLAMHHPWWIFLSGYVLLYYDGGEHRRGISFQIYPYWSSVETLRTNHQIILLSHIITYAPSFMAQLVLGEKRGIPGQDTALGKVWRVWVPLGERGL